MAAPRDRIERRSARYGLLKRYVDVCLRAYFPLTVEGLGNIPPKGAHIYAPNHQNALIDALAVLAARRRWQPVFLARADIFRKPWVAKILTFLKILPVYRIRDGYQSLTLNDAVFRKTLDVLTKGDGLVILPEGNHHGVKRLRPLRKGIARIAFQALAAADGGLELYIIPVGLDYTHYVNFGSPLYVRFGPPIPVRRYLAGYQSNPARAHNTLIQLIARGMREEIVHIEEEAFSEGYRVMLDAFVPCLIDVKGSGSPHARLFYAQRRFLKHLREYARREPDEILLVIAKALEYGCLMQKNGLRIPNPLLHRACSLPRFTGLLLSLTATLPVFVCALALNALAVGLTFMAGRMVKDPQFVASVRFGLGIALFPLLHLLQALALGLATGSWLAALALLLIQPLSLLLYFQWRTRAITLYTLLRRRALGALGRKDMQRLEQLAHELGGWVEGIYRRAYQDEFSGFLSAK